MGLSLYDACVGVADVRLAGLDGFVRKAWDEAQGRKFEEQVLLDARLFPDMFPLRRQIQIACDFAKNGSARAAGLEPPAMPDEEASFDELFARIAATRAFLKTLDAGQFEGREDVEVSFPMGPNERGSLPAGAYVARYMLPNFYFHLTTAYGILRASGLSLGKRDFFGGL
jgi:uncharacterized protein